MRPYSRCRALEVLWASNCLKSAETRRQVECLHLGEVAADTCDNLAFC